VGNLGEGVIMHWESSLIHSERRGMYRSYLEGMHD